MVERMKRSLKRAIWHVSWLLAASTFFFFAVAEFVRQHRIEKAAAANGIVEGDSSALIGQDAAMGLACIALVCLLVALRQRHHKSA